MRVSWIRAGGLAGVAGVVVALATFPMVGGSPKSSASASAIASYLARHQSGLRLAGVLVVLSAALLAWFAGTFVWVLFDRDRRSPASVIVALAASAMVLVLAGDGVLTAVLSFMPRRGIAADSATSALYVLQNGIVMPGAYGFIVAVFLVAVATAALRGLLAGTWLAYPSLVLAALSLAGGALGLSSLDGGTSSPVSYSPAIATSLVTVIIAIGLLRQGAARLQTIIEPAELSRVGAG